MNYEQHVRPIFREHCFTCHNQQKLSGGLALDSYSAVMQGGASGEVVYPEDLEGSRLWALVNHDDEPAMPPNQDKLPEEKLRVIRQWIEQGTLERSDSVVRTSTSLVPGHNIQSEISAGRPGAMPEGLFRQPVTVSSRTGAALAIAASPNAPLIAVAGPRQVCLYHAETYELLAIIPYREGTPQVVQFSRDGSHLMIAGGRGGSFGNAVLVDVQSGQRQATIGDELDSVLAADVDATLSWIALGGPSRRVKVFALKTGELSYELTKHTDWITALAFSPDGKFLATGDRQGGLMVWETVGGGEYQAYQGHAARITAIRWRADSQIMVTASEDGTLRLWDTTRAEPLKSWSAHAGGVLDVTFDREGRILSCGRDQCARRWDATGKQEIEFPKMTEIVLHVVASHDASRTITGDWSGTIVASSANDGATLGLLTACPPSLQQRVELARAALRSAEDDQVAKATAASQHAQGISDAKNSFQATLAQLVSATTELQRLREQNTSLESPLDLTQQEREVSSLEQSCGQLAAKSQILEQSLSPLEQACAAANQRVEACTAAVAVAERELADFQAHLSNWRQELDERARQLEQSRQQWEAEHSDLQLFDEG